MNPRLKTSLASLLIAFAYGLLFYHCEMGINLFLFDALLIGLLMWARPETAKHSAFVWSVGGLLFSAGCVVVVHSEASIFAHHLTYVLVLGYAQARELRFVWFGLLLGLQSLYSGPPRAFQQAKLARRNRMRREGRPGFVPWLKQALVPTLLLVPFVVLYALGNDKFSAGLEGFFGAFTDVRIDGPIAQYLWLSLFGLLLTLGLFFPLRGVSRLVNRQNDFRDDLTRDRKNKLRNNPLYLRPRQIFTSLKREYQQAVLTFGLLNLLLAVVNATDLRYVWLDTATLDAATLSRYVHAGTGNLICSIVLAMVVVLYYFRGNLNFLRGTPYLAPLAKLWIIQNGLLAISVGVRNWHYVDAYGLALGRVHIAFILLLILFGLYSLFRKVRDRLSLTYLLQTNGMAAWLGLLLFAAVNWSGVITRFNLATQTAEEIDWQYLHYGLSDGNTFLLLDHLDGKLNNQKKSSIHQYQPADWRSWNFADWRNLRAMR